MKGSEIFGVSSIINWELGVEVHPRLSLSPFELLLGGYEINVRQQKKLVPCRTFDLAPEKLSFTNTSMCRRRPE